MIYKHIFIFSILFFFQCCEKKINIEEIENEKIENLHGYKGIKMVKNFKKQCDTINSKNIYNQINDTVNKWISLNLTYFNSKIRKRNILTLSKYIYFNTAKDRLVAFIVRQNTSKCFFVDEIYPIIGEKIRDGWWFYFKGVYTINREDYNKNIRYPISYNLLENIGIIVVIEKFRIGNENYLSEEAFNSIEWEIERRYYSNGFLKPDEE